MGHSTDHFDLRKMEILLSGTKDSWNHPNIMKISDSIQKSTHVVFAVPIYCYDVNSAAKNIIELVGRVLNNKIVSFICSAGGANSYMSVMSFANHLMLDFRCIIVPRFLYVQSSDWKNEQELNDQINTRLNNLIDDMNSIQVKPNSR